MAKREISQIWDRLQATHMHNWVGGGDVRQVGLANFRSVVETVLLRHDMRVWDLGCGIGRTAIPLAQAVPEGQVVGTDILPSQIRFCQEEISPHFPNTRFICNLAAHPVYTNYDTTVIRSDIESMSDEEFRMAFEKHFDLVCAFSVWSHFSPEMAEHYLRLVATVTKGSANILLTGFFNHPANSSETTLRTGEPWRDVWPAIPLGFVVYDLSYMTFLIARAGLQLVRVTFGHWRNHQLAGGFPGQHDQDLMLLRKAL